MMMVVDSCIITQEATMVTLTDSLRHVKAHLAEFLPDRVIHRACRDVGHVWRQRVLDPTITTYLLLKQVLHGNLAVGELQRQSGLDFTDSAYCQARQRLPLTVLRALQRAVAGRARAALDDDPDARWKGHRVFFLDGSTFSMPDTEELREAFGQPAGQAEGCGFPVAHLLVQFDARAGYLLQALPSPLRTHDLSKAAATHRDLRPGDLEVGDRAFCSYAHLALLRGRGLHGLFRAHQKLLIDFRPHRRYAPPGAQGAEAKGLPRSRWLKRLGKHDQLVEYHKPKERPQWLSAAAYAALPKTLVVRELRYTLRLPGRRTQRVTLVTTLLDPKRYSARALAKLYGLRWQAETDLKSLKQSLGLDVLRSQTVPGVVKELVAFVIIYNLVRRVMHTAARQQQVEPARISFVDAWRWLKHARPGQTVPKLRVNPERPGRVEPRVRKRRPKQFPVMKRPRAELRQALLRQKDAA
jgi:Transposase DDE domain